MSGFVLPLLLHFHTTKVRQFFHIRKKNNNYFSKKMHFFMYISCSGKKLRFSHAAHTYIHNNNNILNTT